MKFASSFFLSLIAVWAILGLVGCSTHTCPSTSPGTTGGSGSGTSGGTTTTSGTCTSSGGGPGGGVGVGTALVYSANSSVDAFSLTSTGAFGPLSPFTSPTLSGSGADDMIIVGGKFLYIPQASSFMVEGFAIDRSTGALTPIPGNPFAVAKGSDTIASDPQGRFLFVGNESGGDISTFQINASTGALTASPGSPFTFAISSADTFAVDGTGKFLYVGQMSNLLPVHGFAIDQSTGAISELPGSPFTLGISTPHTIAGTNLMVGIPGYVDEGGPSGDNHIYAFAIDPLSGVPTQIGSAPTAASALDFAISPNGKFVYTMEVNSSGGAAAMEGFQMDLNTGALTPLQGSPFTTLPMPAQCKFDQSGNEMFCADALFGSKFSVFSANSTTGALSHSIADLSANSFPFAPTN